MGFLRHVAPLNVRKGPRTFRGATCLRKPINTKPPRSGFRFFGVRDREGF